MVTPRYLPLMGGIETHVYEVGRRLARSGIDLTVLTTDRTGRLPREENSEGMRIRRVPAFPAQMDYYVAPDIYHEIVDGGWDIVHCQGIHTMVPPLAMMAALRANIPFLVTFHTGGHSSEWRNAVRGIQWQMLRPLLARARRLIGVSRFEAELFRSKLRFPPERFVVIPNGGSLAEKSGGKLPQDDTRIILSVGRLEKYKGHQRMIRALPAVLAKYPNARLHIVGSGPYESELKKLAEKCHVQDYIEIYSVPATDRAHMADVISSAALVVLLSDYEAHPIAVMESLALGRPVLVTDTSGLHELAEGRLVSSIPLDSRTEEIAAAVILQLRDPLIPESVQLPTWEDCTEKLMVEYSKICPSRMVIAKIDSAWSMNIDQSVAQLTSSESR
jgi:glycosyltransferase involved in cell wall biosynthesis